MGQTSSRDSRFKARLPKGPQARKAAKKEKVEQIRRAEEEKQEQIRRAEEAKQSEIWRQKRQEQLRQESLREEFYRACENNDADTAWRVMMHDGIKPDATPIHRHGPVLPALHLASKCGHELLVETLIKASASVNAPCYRGRRALHWATLGGNVNVIKLLLEAGATVNEVDHELNTPLHLAVIYNAKQVASALLSAGARVNIFNIDNCNARQIAKQKGNWTIFYMIQEYHYCPPVGNRYKRKEDPFEVLRWD